MDAPTAHTVAPVELRRTIPAPPEKVFRAWTDAAALTRWFAPGEGFTVIVHEADARVGGRYRIEMRHESGRQHIAAGTYREVSAPHRLVFTWGWEGEDSRPETIVTVSLSPSRDGTDLVLVHSGFSEEKDRDDHGTGWAGSLVLLARKV